MLVDLVYYVFICVKIHAAPNITTLPAIVQPVGARLAGLWSLPEIQERLVIQDSGKKGMRWLLPIPHLLSLVWHQRRKTGNSGKLQSPEWGIRRLDKRIN